MNAVQREFLVKKVKSTFATQKDALEKSIPKKPSLNSYIVAALLGGTIKFKPFTEVKDYLLEKAKDGAVLSSSSSSSSYGRSYRNDEEDEEKVYKHTIEVPAEDLFIIPKEYEAELEKYHQKKKEVKNKIAELQAQVNTLELKITVGSPVILQKFIAQVDALGDVDLMADKLIGIERRNGLLK